MNKDRVLYIIGAGAHGKAIYFLAKDLNKWSKIYFLDDHFDKLIKKNKKVIGKINLINKNIKNNQIDFIIGIGDNDIRKKIFTKYFINNKKKLVNIIHPSSSISGSSKILSGTVVFANSVISSNCQIGHCVILNNLSSIDHDVKLSSFVHVSPGVNIAGCVIIRELSWICIGAKISNNINIGKSSVIGAGGIVLSNVKPRSIIVGIHKL